MLSALALLQIVSSFHLVLMAPKGPKRRSKSLADELDRELNSSFGQEITGVTLPAPRQVKGWAFGESKTMVCANVDGKFYALQGDCPRCAFDLWKGDLIADDPGWDDLPRLACPTCSTTFSLRTGRPGPPLKRNGLQAFVTKLAQTSTGTDAKKNAKAFIITREEDGKVYCRERKS